MMTIKVFMNGRKYIWKYKRKDSNEEIFFAYEINNKLLDLFVYDAKTKERLFSISFLHPSSISPRTYLNVLPEHSWILDVLTSNRIAIKTGCSLIPNVDEYSINLIKVVTVEDLSNEIIFIENPNYKAKNIRHNNDNNEKRNRWGLTEYQMKEALNEVHRSKDVEEAIEWYKYDRGIDNIYGF